MSLLSRNPFLPTNLDILRYTLRESVWKDLYNLEMFFCSIVSNQMKKNMRLARGILFLPPSDVCQKLSLSLLTLIKLRPHEALSDWSYIFGSEAKFSPLEIMNLTPFTVSYQKEILHSVMIWDPEIWSGMFEPPTSHQTRFCFLKAVQWPLLGKLSLKGCSSYCLRPQTKWHPSTAQKENLKFYYLGRLQTHLRDCIILNICSWQESMKPACELC